MIFDGKRIKTQKRQLFLNFLFRRHIALFMVFYIQIDKTPQLRQRVGTQIQSAVGVVIDFLCLFQHGEDPV